MQRDNSEDASRHQQQQLLLDDARRSLQRTRRRSPYFRYGQREQGTTLDENSSQTVAQQTRAIWTCWTPYLHLLVLGTRIEQSPLSLLRGNESTLVQHIYNYLIDRRMPYVVLTQPAHSAGRFYDWRRQAEQGHPEHDDQEEGTLEVVLNPIYPRSERAPAMNVLIERYRHSITLGSRKEHRPKIAFSVCGRVEFPPPQGRNVNMLPFIMGDPQSLPDDLQPYYEAAIAQCPIEESEIGKVLYLTVMESLVQLGKTQRRDGLHVEAPGTFTTDASFTAAVEHCWGQGIAFSPDELHGGLFIASNMDNTCKVWNALVPQPGVVDGHGGMEHLRPLIGDGYAIAANELVWLTDKTPHEALPQPTGGYRQFFRLVTSEISVWFAEHSTPNPKVPLPDFVTVIEGSKFA